MRYSDGKIAKIGDFVIGKGYNIRDVAGIPKTIIGEVVGLVENIEACNLRIFTLQSRIDRSSPLPDELGYTHDYGAPTIIGKMVLEYGETKSFTLVHRPKVIRPRNRSDLWTPAETAIQTAVNYVEDVGADPLLTEAVTLLGQARDKVADYVDKTVNV